MARRLANSVEEKKKGKEKERKKREKWCRGSRVSANELSGDRSPWLGSMFTRYITECRPITSITY